MDPSELRNLLNQLHERLGSSPSLDADDRRLLTTLMGDIEAVLAKGSAARADTPGMETLAVKFEADHPALADGLRRLADTLGKAGI